MKRIPRGPNRGTWRARLAVAMIAAPFLAPSACAAASLFGAVRQSVQLAEFDADTGAVLNSFPVPGLAVLAVGGEGLALGGGDLFVASIDLQSIQRLDPATGALRGSLPLPAGGSGVGFDALGYGSTSFGPTLFAANAVNGQIYLLDPQTGAVRTSYQPAFSPNGGLEFSPTTGTLFVSDVTGRIHQIQPETGSVVDSFEINARPLGIALVGARLFISQMTSPSITERTLAGELVRSFTTAAGNIGGLTGSPVPEPTTLGQSLLGAALALARRRGRSTHRT